VRGRAEINEGWELVMVDNADALQARLFGPDSNTLVGQRILDNAPPPAPGFGSVHGVS
jgi:hypothetical protein